MTTETTGKFQHLPHYLSLGAGVQSSTLALMYACGELEPMPKAAIFADTGAEPDAVYDWLDWLSMELPFPISQVKRNGTDLETELYQLKENKKGEVYSASMVPFFVKHDVTGEETAVLGRQCTNHYKIQPIIKELRRLENIKRGEKNPQVVSCIGISTDEFRRMKPSRTPFIYHRWPLIEKRMSRLQCLHWMESKGYPQPPRSACTFCAFRSSKEWRKMQLEDPASFAHAVKVERNMQHAKSQNTRSRATPYFHKSCKPLDEIDFRTDVERGQKLLWDDECEGMCGV